MKGRDLLALSFRLVGLVFAVIAAVSATVTLLFVLRAERTAGVVIDYSIVQNSISFMPGSDATGMLFYPIVAYTAADGAEYRLTGRSGRPNRRYAPGEELPVLYSANNASEGRLDTVMGVWGTAIIMGGLAAIFVVLGFAAPHGFGGSKKQ